jgi:hypothetical protein
VRAQLAALLSAVDGLGRREAGSPPPRVAGGAAARTGAMLMARNASMTDGGITPVFRLSGQYDRYGRQLGWLARVAEDGVNVYHHSCPN